MTTPGAASGVVLRWSAEEGWGVILADATPGGCWAHFSTVARGGADLQEGDEVRFTLEPASQDGHDFRAIEVWPADAAPDRSLRVEGGGGSAGYRSELHLSFDEPGEDTTP